MKSLLITIITIYQKIISPVLHQLLGVKKVCRYEKACTVYSKEVIAKYGASKGFVLSVRRIASCQPFFSL